MELSGLQERGVQADLPLTAAIRQSQQTCPLCHPDRPAGRVNPCTLAALGHLPLLPLKAIGPPGVVSSALDTGHSPSATAMVPAGSEEPAPIVQSPEDPGDKEEKGRWTRSTSALCQGGGRLDQASWCPVTPEEDGAGGSGAQAGRASAHPLDTLHPALSSSLLQLPPGLSAEDLHRRLRGWSALALGCPGLCTLQPPPLLSLSRV
nr:uncharacterized protein LOC131275296 [Dasypus novemcinctus]